MRCTVYEVVREGAERALVALVPTIGEGEQRVVGQQAGEYAIYKRVYAGTGYECLVEARCASALPVEGMPAVRRITVTPSGEAIVSVESRRTIRPGVAA